MSALGRSHFSAKELRSQEGALFLDHSIHSHNKSVWKHRVERASRSGALVLSAAIHLLPHPTSCPAFKLSMKKENRRSSPLFINTDAALHSLRDAQVDLGCFSGLVRNLLTGIKGISAQQTWKFDDKRTAIEQENTARH